MGKHCWHDKWVYPTGMAAILSRICCRCGVMGNEFEMTSPWGHGPHAPVEWRLVETPCPGDTPKDEP